VGEFIFASWLADSLSVRHPILNIIDETLPIINKPKHPKRENIRNKMEGPTSKKTKESPRGLTTRGASSS
jgi:hypothetical protein